MRYWHSANFILIVTIIGLEDLIKGKSLEDLFTMDYSEHIMIRLEREAHNQRKIAQHTTQPWLGIYNGSQLHSLATVSKQWNIIIG